MSDKNQNKELQSRREFFKKAAKVALPIVGAVVLSSVPQMLSATQAGQCTCSNSCVSSCSNTCLWSCYNTCKTSCRSGCKHSLK